MRIRPASSNNIVRSFQALKGNARVSVMCEPLWGVPFVLFNFYLSLYMKELGVTDEQLGYIISIGFIAGTFFSLASGYVVDRLGRKKTTLIFDLISWPLAVVIYFIANSFAMFALATVLNSLSKIVGVSWNLMVVEDADDEQRIAAFNLLNIINIASGVIIPIAGILVGEFGVVRAERIFLAFAVVSMTTMIIVRNYLYRETKIGMKILEERKRNPASFNWKSIVPLKAAGTFRGKPKAIIAVVVYILFLIYIPLGSINSLYFAPFMTEVLKLGESSISVLGGVYSGVIFFIFVFIIPAITGMDNAKNMQFGLAIQAISLLLLILIPESSFTLAILCIATYAVGFGLCRPFLDTMLAGETEGDERAGIYSLVNTITCVATAFTGLVSGSIYLLDPRLIYIISVIILVVCIVLLVIYRRLSAA